MDEFKTNMEKMMERINVSLMRNSADPFVLEDTERTPKKRRLSIEDNSDSINNASGTSLNVSNGVKAPPSPWEVRRMKADLIDARTRNANLKQEIERLHRKYNESEAEYQRKITELTKQSDFTSNKVLDLEKHMQVLRKREHAAKQELIKVQRELSGEKINYEDTISQLQNAKLKLETESRQVQSVLNSELNEHKHRAEKVSMELEVVSEELCSVRNQLEDTRQRLEAHDELSSQYEQQQQELVAANSRIEELENQIATYNDWKQIVNTTKSRLQNFPEMEREIQRLKERNSRLEELIGNKLLLEEQVHALQARLERKENSPNDVIALQVKLQHVEQELKEWIKVAQDYCLPNMVVCPMALRTRIQQLLENDIVVKSDQRTNAKETKQLESELTDYKQKCEIFNKNIEELHTALKRHKNFKERVQRKLYLISKERDFYKQMLDQNSERDLTINTTTDPVNLEYQQLRARVEMLEKTLAGYKEMCSNLEKDLVLSRQSSADSGQGFDLIDGPGYDHIKKELDSLRLENERLRSRKDTLELELEQRTLRGNLGAKEGKVLHFIHNPADEAYDKNCNLIEKLQAEIERLKRRNQKLDDDKEPTQTCFNETNNMTMNIKELNTLRAELETTNAKMKRMKEAYKSVNLEFREVCYMLFGYKIDRVGANANYKLSSMYAESPDDYLNFRLNESNTLDMLETPYMATLKSFIESQLMVNKSIPAFLSALTLELFQRATVTQA